MRKNMYKLGSLPIGYHFRFYNGIRQYRLIAKDYKRLLVLYENIHGKVYQADFDKNVCI